jgi:hypothetical protein
MAGYTNGFLKGLTECCSACCKFFMLIWYSVAVPDIGLYRKFSSCEDHRWDKDGVTDFQLWVKISATRLTCHHHIYKQVLSGLSNDQSVMCVLIFSILQTQTDHHHSITKFSDHKLSKVSKAFYQSYAVCTTRQVECNRIYMRSLHGGQSSTTYINWEWFGRSVKT